MENSLKTNLFIVSLFLVLTGCAGLGKDQKQGLSLSPAELPMYQRGEYYIYDNDLMMTVVWQKGDLVKWNIGGNESIVSHRDFSLPWIAWEDNQSTYSTILPEDSPSIWPIYHGQESTYQSVQKIVALNDSQEREVLRNWKCKVEVPERVQVPAGVFNTHVISCNRYSGINGAWRGSDKYYFAPSIGHYVMVDRSYSSRSSTAMQLIDYGFNSNLLSDAEQAELRSQLYAVLDNEESGKVEFWQSRDGLVGVMLSATPVYIENNRKCRKYTSTYSASGKVSSHEKIMCGDGKGSWSSFEISN